MFYGTDQATLTGFKDWDVSKVTDISGMFQNQYASNPDVSDWITSSLYSANAAFRKCHNFDQDLSKWDVSNLRYASGMFSETYRFKGSGISDWVTTKLEYASFMFRKAYSFNQPLNWNTDEVATMERMFEQAYSFNQNISNFKTSKLKNINNMLRDAVSFNHPLNNWDVSTVDNRRPFKDQTLVPRIQDTESVGIFSPWTNKMSYMEKCMDSTTKVDDKWQWQTFSGATDLYGCTTLCTDVTCDSANTDKNTKIPNILAGDAETCCGPAWVVKCGLGTKVDITEGECVGDPSSYSDSGQLRARWRELNKCENEQ